jgi:hypothetical protein
VNNLSSKSSGRPLAVAFLAIFLAGCASSYQAYSGSQLPGSKVATVTLNTPANIMLGYDVGLKAVDGAKPPKAVDEFTLLPGDHSIDVVLFRVGPTGGTAQVGEMALAAHVEENKHYVLYWDVPNSRIVFREA